MTVLSPASSASLCMSRISTSVPESAPPVFFEKKLAGMSESLNSLKKEIENILLASEYSNAHPNEIINALRISIEMPGVLTSQK